MKTKWYIFKLTVWQQNYCVVCNQIQWAVCCVILTQSKYWVSIKYWFLKAHILVYIALESIAVFSKGVCKPIVRLLWAESVDEFVNLEWKCESMMSLTTAYFCERNIASCYSLWWKPPNSKLIAISATLWLSQFDIICIVCLAVHTKRFPFCTPFTPMAQPGLYPGWLSVWMR